MYYLQRKPSLAEGGLFDGLPRELLFKLIRTTFHKEIQIVDFFRKCDLAFLSQLIVHVRPYYALAGDIVYEMGDIANEMTFITRGSVGVSVFGLGGVGGVGVGGIKHNSLNGEDSAVRGNGTNSGLRTGSDGNSRRFPLGYSSTGGYFGDIEYVKHSTRLARYHAVENCTLLAISYDKIKEAVEKNPIPGQLFLEELKSRYDNFETVSRGCFTAKILPPSVLRVSTRARSSSVSAVRTTVQQTTSLKPFSKIIATSLKLPSKVTGNDSHGKYVTCEVDVEVDESPLGPEHSAAPFLQPKGTFLQKMRRTLYDTIDQFSNQNDSFRMTKHPENHWLKNIGHRDLWVDGMREPSFLREEAMRNPSPVTYEKNSGNSIQYTTVTKNKHGAEVVGERTIVSVQRLFLIHPKDKRKTAWDGLIGLLIIYSVLTVPIQVAFISATVTKSGKSALLFESVIDVFFLLDILLNFNTAYFSEQDDAFIAIRKRIVFTYLRSWFVVDAISCIPFDTLLGFILSTSSTNLQTLQLIRIARLLRLIKILKFINFVKLFYRLEDIFDISPAFLSLCVTLTQVIFIAHLICCMWWCLCTNISRLTWYDDIQLVYSPMRDATFQDQYVASLYWTITTLTTVGYGDIVPVNNQERLLTIFVMVIGATVFGFVVANVGTIVRDFNQLEAKSTDRLAQMVEFMKERNCPCGVMKEVTNHFKKIFRHNSSFDEETIVARLPARLRIELALVQHSALLERIPIFKYIKNVSLKLFLLNMMTSHFADVEKCVLKEGDEANEMIFMVTGKCLICRILTPSPSASLRSNSTSGKSVESVSKREKEVINRGRKSTVNIGHPWPFQIRIKPTRNIPPSTSMTSKMMTEKKGNRGRASSVWDVDDSLLSTRKASVISKTDTYNNTNANTNIDAIISTERNTNIEANTRRRIHSDNIDNTKCNTNNKTNSNQNARSDGIIRNVSVHGPKISNDARENQNSYKGILKNMGSTISFMLNKSLKNQSRRLFVQNPAASKRARKNWSKVRNLLPNIAAIYRLRKEEEIYGYDVSNENRKVESMFVLMDVRGHLERVLCDVTPLGEVKGRGFVGHSAMMQSRCYASSVVVTEACHYYSLHNRDILALAREQPGIALELQSALSMAICEENKKDEIERKKKITNWFLDDVKERFRSSESALMAKQKQPFSKMILSLAQTAKAKEKEKEREKEKEEKLKQENDILKNNQKERSMLNKSPNRHSHDKKRNSKSIGTSVVMLRAAIIRGSIGISSTLKSSRLAAVAAVEAFDDTAINKYNKKYTKRESLHIFKIQNKDISGNKTPKFDTFWQRMLDLDPAARSAKIILADKISKLEKLQTMYLAYVDEYGLEGEDDSNLTTNNPRKVLQGRRESALNRGSLHAISAGEMTRTMLRRKSASMYNVGKNGLNVLTGDRFLTPTKSPVTVTFATKNVAKNEELATDMSGGGIVMMSKGEGEREREVVNQGGGEGGRGGENRSVLSALFPLDSPDCAEHSQPLNCTGSNSRDITDMSNGRDDDNVDYGDVAINDCKTLLNDECPSPHNRMQPSSLPKSSRMAAKTTTPPVNTLRNPGKEVDDGIISLISLSNDDYCAENSAPLIASLFDSENGASIVSISNTEMKCNVVDDTLRRSENEFTHSNTINSEERNKHHNYNYDKRNSCSDSKNRPNVDNDNKIIVKANYINSNDKDDHIDNEINVNNNENGSDSSDSSSDNVNTDINNIQIGDRGRNRIELFNTFSLSESQNNNSNTQSINTTQQNHHNNTDSTEITVKKSELVKTISPMRTKMARMGSVILFRPIPSSQNITQSSIVTPNIPKNRPSLLQFHSARLLESIKKKKIKNKIKKKVMKKHHSYSDLLDIRTNDNNLKLGSSHSMFSDFNFKNGGGNSSFISLNPVANMKRRKSFPSKESDLWCAQITKKQII